MSQAVPHDFDPTRGISSRAREASPPRWMPGPWGRTPGIGAWVRRLPAASFFLAVCGLAAFTMLDVIGELNAAPPSTVAPTAVPVSIPTGDTSVPDASAVFAGRQYGIEAPTATF